jgi:hypothetical protein
MSKSSRGLRSLSDILGELFAVRGYSQRWARQELEDVWNAAVGEPDCRQTRVGEVRGGVLSVTVAHSTLLEELTAFRKPALLVALRSGAPATTIHDIRFRVGAVVLEVESPSVLASSSSAAAKPAWHRQPTPRQRAQPGKRSTSHRSSGYNPGQP